LVSIGFDGEPEYVYGLLRKEDERAWQSSAQTSEHTEEGPAPSSCVPPPAPEKHGKEGAAYSAALIESLTTHKTAALAAELTQQPAVALAAVVHALALQEFRLDWYGYGEGSSLQLSSRTPSLAAAENSPVCLFLAEQRQTWFAQLPPDPGELWPWCLRQDQDTLLRLLAFCAARSLNAIRAKSEFEQPQRLAHANAVGTALNLEMRKWFTPTADNFFSRISKAQIIGVGA
jgi:ParB family transcriptional regulator, chromosome partitioning protein